MRKNNILISLVILVCSNSSDAMQLTARKHTQTPQEPTPHSTTLPSAQDAFNALLITAQPANTQQLLDIVCRDIMNNLRHCKTRDIKENICDLALPRVNAPNLTHTKRTEVYNDLARTMLQSDEFITQIQTHLSIIEIQPEQLNLEQMLYLFLTCTLQPFQGSRAGPDNSHHHWILYHSCFDKMPETIQKALFAHNLTGCKSHLFFIHGRRLIIITSILALIVIRILEKTFETADIKLEQKIGSIPTIIAVIIALPTMLFAPPVMLANHYTNKEIKQKFRTNFT